MGISNGYDIGVNGRDLILKTSGKIYVKVSDKFYELDFKNEKSGEKKANSEGDKTSDVILLDTLSKETYPGDNKIVINNDELYITKGGSFKKINDSKETLLSSASFESLNTQSDSLFVKISNNIWGFGQTSSGYDIEFLQDVTTKWNDYLFFNSVKDYFFDDVYGYAGDEDSFWENIFFNTSGDDPKLWTSKSRSQIEGTILNEVYKDGVLVKIEDFFGLYNCFWGSESVFNDEISEYAGEYALISFEKWSGVFSPRSKITIGKCVAIVTAVIGDSAIIKFKDENVTLNPDNIQQTEDTIIFYENNDVAFLDVLDSDLKIYNNLLQNEEDVRIRLGNLNTLSGYSGIGSFFNKNITIKNPPFVLNSDGSGGIAETFCWDVNGELYGTFVDFVNNLKVQYEELLEKVQNLENNQIELLNKNKILTTKVESLEKNEIILNEQYNSLLKRIENLETKK